MEKTFISRDKDVRLVTKVKVETKEEEEVFRKEFQKMIRKCNHLLKNKMNYKLTIIRDDRCNPLE